MKRRRWFYVWLLPPVWTATSVLAVAHPGDEYGLWAVGSMAGVWMLALVGDDGSVRDLVPVVAATGATTMAVVGLLLDLLRAPRRMWALLWLLAGVTVCLTSLGSFPNYARAMSKNGSLWAYVLFSLNFGLYLACALMLLVMPPLRLLHRRPPPGHCRHCGYDLTGNVSGTCPECGGAVEQRLSHGE